METARGSPLSQVHDSGGGTHLWTQSLCGPLTWCQTLACVLSGFNS